MSHYRRTPAPGSSSSSLAGAGVRPQPSGVPYRCAVGHLTYQLDAPAVVFCPYRIARGMQCGAKARREVPATND